MRNYNSLQTVTIRSKYAAWINADIRGAIKQRYRLFKKAKRSNKDEDWRAYRTYRNLVTTKIRDRKLEYLNELDLKASDPKQFGTKKWWKLVKQFMNKKRHIRRHSSHLLQWYFVFFQRRQGQRIE